MMAEIFLPKRSCNKNMNELANDVIFADQLGQFLLKKEGKYRFLKAGYEEKIITLSNIIQYYFVKFHPVLKKNFAHRSYLFLKDASKK